MLRRRVVLIAVAAVVVVGGGSWIGVKLTSASNTHTPIPTASSTGLSQVWRVPFGEATTSTGAWVNDQQIVAGYDTAVTAYAMDTGRVEWTWRPPTGQLVAKLSTNTDNGIGVLFYEDSDRVPGATKPKSSTMMAIDLATGHPLWTRTNDPRSDSTGPVYLSGGRIAILTGGVLGQGTDQEEITAFDLATGAPEWTASSASAGLTACALRSDAFVGDFLYVEGYCGGSDTKLGTSEVFALALDTGTVRVHITPAPKCHDDSTVWSVVGHVIADCELNAGSPPMWVSTPGAHSMIPADPSVAPLMGNVTDPGGRSPNFAAFGDTVYVIGSGPDNGAVDAVDLSSGRKLWSRPLPAGYTGWMVGATANGADVAVDNGSVLSLVHYSPTGTETPGPGSKIAVPGPFPQPTDVRIELDGTNLVAIGQVAARIPDPLFKADAVTVFHTGTH